MIEFESEGKKYVFRGEYRRPVRGEYFLSDWGSVRQCNPKVWDTVRAVVLPALEPTLEQLELGGIVFEKTGEYRAPKEGEWFIADWHTARAALAGAHVCGSYDILCPIEVKRD